MGENYKDFLSTTSLLFQIGLFAYIHDLIQMEIIAFSKLHIQFQKVRV